MECIADGLRQLRAAAIQRRDTAAAEVDAIDDLLGHLDGDGDLANLVPVTVVMQRLGLGRSTVHELIAAGRLPVRRIGRAVRVPLDAVEAIQRHGDQPVGIDRSPGRAGTVPPTGTRNYASPVRPVPARLWHRR